MISGDNNPGSARGMESSRDGGAYEREKKYEQAKIEIEEKRERTGM